MQRYSWTNNRQPVFSSGPAGPSEQTGYQSTMVDVLAAPQQVKADTSLRTLSAISAAHWVSHFHLMVLPMLFPFLKEQLGVGYIELGFALTVSAVVSGLTQAPIGYLADYIGARKILLIGLIVGGLALIMLGLHLSYAWLIASAVLLGIANSVYHPADYAILSAHMDEARMGRAFSIHTFAGFLGGAVAPAIVAALVATTGGHGALIVAGAAGPLVALLLVALGTPDASAADRQIDGARAPRQNVITPALIMLTIFFMLLNLSNAGIGNFGVVALMSGYGVTFSSANIALTAFLGFSAVGVLAGGFLADYTRRHSQVAAACFAVNAVIVLIIATIALPSLLLTAAMGTAGFLGGVIAPSRDMLVRNTAPAGAAGRAFGIVSTGFNLGGVVSPLLFGWIMDQNMPHWVFGASVVFMMLTVLLALVTDRKPQDVSEGLDEGLLQP
ncbi:Sugar phosphate permease [Bradyrhizobium erythrophlei]|uniref:Sugar phosphate permease n=2 Tax=Bradyrhizobium erythrophlei TaxID=1437360 RepID=A0A1M5GRG8_9BRAD|nr:Sugar phosphate permease [Bradyrhizobium erythrophlei]